MSEERFYIDCYGICDTWRKGNTCKETKLTWKELCNTLNELDDLCNNKFDEYEYIIKLKKENEQLKFKLESTKALLQKVKDYFDDIGLIIDD
jgi:hypothetical protein